MLLAWAVGLLISAKRMLTLVRGDQLRRFDRRSAGVVAVAAIPRLIGAAFFARVVMAMVVVGDRRGGLTDRRGRRRLIRLRRMKNSAAKRGGRRRGMM